MSSQPLPSNEKAEIKLNPCVECGAPMLLMSVTQALHHPITLRKTYECFVCQSVEVVVAPECT
jgi:hypothetical protein